MRLGTCVTNPATRDITVTASALATLNEVTGGRMDLGIGRGDSARRVMGKQPTTVAYMEECCRIVRSLTGGKTVTLDGTDIQMPWATNGPVPIWVAGYGPMALAPPAASPTGSSCSWPIPTLSDGAWASSARPRKRPAATPTRSR